MAKRKGNDAMTTTTARLAATVLTSEKGRKTVGWVLTAILSPVILLVAFLCCVGSGTAEHNSAVVSAAFYVTELSTIHKCLDRIPGADHAAAGIVFSSGFGSN
jgi:ATP/ADP translocase